LRQRTSAMLLTSKDIAALLRRGPSRICGARQPIP
jgi:hypothetical protein